MAYIFGDGFDCYAAVGDTTLGYWDGGSVTNSSLVAGRFSGGQAFQTNANGVFLIYKSSGANDGIHHIVCAFRQTAALSGTTLGFFFQLVDGVTGQCCIVFRSDGTILLTSGIPSGAVLATWTGGLPAANTWTAYEFEVVIHNTAGSFTARRNGNTSNDFTATNLNTRTTANNYANRLQTGMQATITSQQFDDLLWRSDAASVPFVGDIRAYTRMPASDVSVQFARSPNPALVPQTNVAGAGTASKAANLGIMSAFTASFDGTITTGTVSVNTGATGNMKVAIYDSARALVLATSNAIVNPVSGNNTLTLTAPLTVTKGTVYYLAVDQDVTIIYNSTTSNYSFTTTYASFPANSPVTTAGSPGPTFVVSLVPTNATLVAEAQQDGATSYVYSATTGQSDLYGIAALAATPVSVVAVTTRGYIQKSDAGTRNGAVQLKSGATTVQSTSTALSTTFGWLWRTDSVDPATSTAWTPVAVNNVNIGPVCTL